MPRFPILALSVLLFAPQSIWAQVCAGYPMSAGTLGFSALVARETFRDNEAYAASTRWKARDWLAVDGTVGVSEFAGSHELRGATAVIFEVPLKRFSLCSFAGMEHRYHLLGGFTVRDWVFPIGISLGYNRPIGAGSSIFAYAQPHYLIWRKDIDPLGPTSGLYGVSWKLEPALRSGLGIRHHRVLAGVESVLTSADEATAFNARLTYFTRGR